MIQHDNTLYVHNVTSLKKKAVGPRDYTSGCGECNLLNIIFNICAVLQVMILALCYLSALVVHPLPCKPGHTSHSAIITGKPHQHHNGPVVHPLRTRHPLTDRKFSPVLGRPIFAMATTM